MLCSLGRIGTTVKPSGSWNEWEWKTITFSHSFSGAQLLFLTPFHCHLHHQSLQDHFHQKYICAHTHKSAYTEYIPLQVHTISYTIIRIKLLQLDYFRRWNPISTLLLMLPTGHKSELSQQNYHRNTHIHSLFSLDSFLTGWLCSGGEALPGPALAQPRQPYQKHLRASDPGEGGERLQGRAHGGPWWVSPLLIDWLINDCYHLFMKAKKCLVNVCCSFLKGSNLCD